MGDDLHRPAPEVPAWLDSSLYPFRPRRLELEGGTMSYVDEGEGPPVVLVHGNPTWSFLFRDVVRGLSHRHRCVVPDHLGFGLSDKPLEWSGRPRDHARNLAALLAALDLDGFILVVHDWGGPIGLSRALDRPGAVRGIVLLNTWMWPVDDDLRLRAFSRIVGSGPGRFVIRRFDLFVRMGMKAAFADPSRLTGAVHRHYLQPLDRPDARRASAVLPGEILASGPWLDSLWERRGLLRDIPTRIVWGMEDPAFRGRHLERWTRVFPDAGVTRLEGVGHYVPEEAPDPIVRAVEEMPR